MDNVIIVATPKRPPDFIDKGGNRYWFLEMVADLRVKRRDNIYSFKTKLTFHKSRGIRVYGMELDSEYHRMLTQEFAKFLSTKKD